MEFGVRECADIVFKAKSAMKIGSHVFKADEPVLYLDTAKTSMIETSATSGRGNFNPKGGKLYEIWCS